MQQNILVGVYDWRQFGLDDHFYPADLPADWRLGYFANEFETTCLLLDEADLTGLTSMDELEDLPDGFRLHFEWVGETPGKALKSEQVQQLNHLKALHSARAPASPALFIHSNDCWTPQQPVASAFARLPGDADLKQYRRWIELWSGLGGQPQRLWLEGAQASAARLAEVRTLVELMGL